MRYECYGRRQICSEQRPDIQTASWKSWIVCWWRQPSIQYNSGDEKGKLHVGNVHVSNKSQACFPTPHVAYTFTYLYLYLCLCLLLVSYRRAPYPHVLLILSLTYTYTYAYTYC